MRIHSARERAALVRGSVLAALALLVGIFTKLAFTVVNGAQAGFDSAIMLAMRNPADRSDPIGPGWFEEMMRDFTALGGNGVLTSLTLLAALLLALSGKRREAMLFLAAVVGALVIGNLLKLGFDRPRPELVPHQTHVYTSSFPSSHAAMSATIYLALAAVVTELEVRRAIRVLALVSAVLATFLVGASRVYLGVHWPSDVIAGWSVGVAAALCCWLALVHLHHGPTPPATD